MEIGISALLFNIDEALEICEKTKEITHIELGIDNLYECDMVHKYKDKIKDLGLTLGIHLPMELNTCENIEYIRKSWATFFNKLSSRLKDFDVKYFNFHLGYGMGNRLGKSRNKYLNNSISFFNDIDSDDIICIENVYSEDGDFSNIGNIAYDFEYIFNSSRNSNIYFCYDTGHNLINEDKYFEKLSNKIKVVHLSDNDGIKDMHIGIGKGILCESHIKSILNINPEYMVLEINYKHIEDTMKKIKSILEGA